MKDGEDAAAPFRPRDAAAHPALYAPDYRSTRLRAPSQPLIKAPAGAVEPHGPVFTATDLGPLDADLLQNFRAATGVETEVIGERIIVHGRVEDEHGRPVPDCLIEVWQANAGGRYRHVNDRYLAPLDPAFGGGGRCITDADGVYRFRTVRPGPYPWPNGDGAWRPAHIHLSIFGEAFSQRLMTQLYFEGDPLIARCPIVQSIADPAAVGRLVAALDMSEEIPFDSLAYRFDIVLRGRRRSLFEPEASGA